MSTKKTELLAAYWTLAGDVYPGAQTEVSPYSLQARAMAAANAGYTGMGLVHADIVANKEKFGLQGIKNILNGCGIHHVEVEFLADWFYPVSDIRHKISNEARLDLLEAAHELGARNLKISPALFETAAPDVPHLQDEFSKLCEQGREVGVNVVMEMMPFTNINKLDVAIEIIGGANQANGGLLLDIWHLVRGGMDYSEIAKIPKNILKAIELDDASSVIEGTLFDDTRFSRKLCGEGDFNIPLFLNEVVKAGFDAPYYGVEIISKSFRQLPLDVMAKTSFDSTIKQFDNVSF